MTDLAGRVWQGDANEWLRMWPEASVQCCITSPPYNAGMDYGEGIEDALDWDAYWRAATEWLIGIRWVLCEGGRLILNVPAIMGRSPAEPVAAHYTLLLHELDFRFRGEIVWFKNASRNNATAWGSWCSPANPSLRDTHEKILVASKGSWGMPNPRGEQSDLTPEMFTRDTLSVWRMACERKREHPCPFPEELVERAMRLYTWPGDLVIDPFIGSGTVGVVAERLGRRWAGCDLSAEYCAMAERRIRREAEKLRLPLEAVPEEASARMEEENGE